jgi:L-threonylcarbamoyladenylate synthase
VKTILTRSPVEAAAVIRRGGLAAFPTETVYGLGADAFDEEAIGRIFSAKGRPADNPLIVHVASVEMIEHVAKNLNDTARMLVEKFFPGSLTLVVERADGIPAAASAGLETIGVRMPRLPLALEFLAACDRPVAAPSANLSGRPSPTSWRAVLEDLDGRIECVLTGDDTEIGLESTVVDCTTPVPVVLRAGALSIEDIRQAVPDAVEFEGNDIGPAKSPGLRHKHYAPNARVVIVSNTAEVHGPDDAFIGLSKPEGKLSLCRVCTSKEEYARSLFEFFRECDRRGISTIYCEAVDESGIGRALMDRLSRAEHS